MTKEIKSSTELQGSVKKNKRHEKLKKRGDYLIKSALLLRKLIIKDKVSVTENFEEVVEAQHLLYREYRRKKLCEINSKEQYYNPYTFLQTTRMLVSKRKKQIIGTISIVGDGGIGMPADTLYPNELNSLREQGMNLIEIGSLSVDSRLFKKKAHMFSSLPKISTTFTLFTGMINYVKNYTNATHLIIMINPAHKSLYDYIGFKRFAENKLYPYVNKAAVPMIMNIDEFLSSNKTNMSAKFALKNWQVLVPKRSHKFTARDILVSIEDNIDFINKLTPMQFSALINEYPTLKSLLRELNVDVKLLKTVAPIRKCRTRPHSSIFSKNFMDALDIRYTNYKKNY